MDEDLSDCRIKSEPKHTPHRGQTGLFFFLTFLFFSKLTASQVLCKPARKPGRRDYLTLMHADVLGRLARRARASPQVAANGQQGPVAMDTDKDDQY